MKAPDCIVLDFETHAIEPRPNYPPKPVSLALKFPNESQYRLMAWGHGDGSKAAGNNCTEKEARGELKRAYASKYPILAQNFAFDGDVAETHWQLALPSWERYHETMFLLFLHDPHSPSLALKPCAERYLGMPPEEQDRMNEWILANVPEAKRKPSTAGAYIWRCPYQIVKPYHKGDLTRTLGLFNLLYPRIVDAGMLPAYDRERKLMPILLRNARRGMRIDIEKLERDTPRMKAGVIAVDKWLANRLGVSGINLDSDRQLAKALYDKGVVTEFKRTPKGQLSISKANLTIDQFKDKKVYQALTYRAQMTTCVNMFMEPWLELAGAGEVIHPNWAQVRSPKGADTQGARSGRIICNRPNLLNLPKKWKRSASAGYVHPAWLKIPELPFIRSYALPSKGKRWGRRDYNQNEVRLFAHFEEGPIMAGFTANPRFDMHEDVRAAEEEALVSAGLRTEFGRDDAKGTVFGAFYGQGLTGLMVSLKLRDPEDRGVGQIIHRALHAAVPSIKALSNQLKEVSQAGRPIRTIGGRLYYVEEPRYMEKFGRNMTWEYKLISYLIQGSGADVMKEAICRYYEHPKRNEEMLVTVYDELDVDMPMSDKGAKQEMTVLRDVMLSVECDVPLLSDGEIGANWGSLEAFSV